jgi:uncharacterized damage-inducible protein DinB
MEPLENYHALARYNAWFNERLYAACAGLADEDRRRDLGAFFGSVHRTLNHLILCDHAWLLRFAPGLDAAIPRDRDGNALRPAGLDAVLYDDFELLRGKRVTLDAAIEAWAAALAPADLDREISYKTTKGVLYRHPMWWALTHFFNHQTHHRGQVTTLLSQLGCDPGVTDFIYMMREWRNAE